MVGEDLEAPRTPRSSTPHGKYLVPGLVDMHVHFRDPGFEYKETIASGLRRGRAGGFTDVATMPNTDPVTDTGPRSATRSTSATRRASCTCAPSAP